MTMPRGDWTVEDERTFVELLISATMNDKIEWGRNNRDAFIVLSAAFTHKVGREYTFAMCLQKYRILHQRYTIWESIISISGINWNVAENRIIMDERFWVRLYSAIPLARRYRDEGEVYWTELRIIFAGHHQQNWQQARGAEGLFDFLNNNEDGEGHEHDNGGVVTVSDPMEGVEEVAPLAGNDVDDMVDAADVLVDEVDDLGHAVDIIDLTQSDEENDGLIYISSSEEDV